MSDEVRRYYDANADLEWRRLENDRVEFAVTMRALREHLPTPPARILDIGGGPGRYAIALAGAGYDVTLADISESELALAAGYAKDAGVSLSAIVHADARDLRAFGDASFDAVVMLGPLYHLLEESGRRRAVGEAMRVLAPGGVLCAAFITRTAVLRYWAKYDPMRVAADPARYEGHLVTGQVRDNDPFTDIYLAHPMEITPFMESCGLRTRDLLGCEGIVSMIRDRINELLGEAWETWMDINYRLARDPSTHGCAEHLLYVGVKPPSPLTTNP